jgi:alpha-tubulin suppressor-like RCC1 family protein
MRHLDRPAAPTSPSLRSSTLLGAVAAAVLLTPSASRGADALDCTPAGPGQLSCWGGLATAHTPKLADRAPATRDTIVVKENRACAVSSGGLLSCWGENSLGQLGDGTRTDRQHPVRVQGVTDVDRVALGRNLTCARTRAAAVFCWGYDDATKAIRLHAVKIPLPKPAVEIVAGGSHACALSVDGTVSCWGYNRYGQLGDGTQSDRGGPVAVRGLQDAVELAAGLYFTCARRRDGTVSCWGNGWGGEDGTRPDLLLPSPVPAIHGAVKLVAGTSGVLVSQAGGHLMSCEYLLLPPHDHDESSPVVRCQPGWVFRRNQQDSIGVLLNGPPARP